MDHEVLELELHDLQLENDRLLEDSANLKLTLEQIMGEYELLVTEVRLRQEDHAANLGLVDTELKQQQAKLEVAEAERAAALEDRCRGALILWSGSFAPFAAAIGRSRLYVGYDSAGQHVAAACGVARITVFNGFPGERFVARWRPEGAGMSQVLLAGEGLMERVWGAVESAIL